MKKFLIFLLQIYQYIISPFFPSTCRYSPSCSSYVIQALQVHGVFKGLLMGIARILRCHPFAKGGFDPISCSFSLIRNKIEDVQSLRVYKNKSE